MKIRCDVCDKKEASVFCTADEAALCDDCDNRVHHANKLASKHSRFSLLQPGFKESPLCDICQERRAFLFCQEDRAILCRECDIPIHKANEHTQKHHRFLLTGAKLSPLSSSSSSSSITTTTSSEAAINRSSVTPLFSTTTTKRLKTVISNNNNNNEISSCSSIDEMTQFPYNSTTNNNSHESGCSYLTSSISEYLMETLPGWHVEDFLDPSSSSSCSASNNNNNNNNNGFCKTNNNDDFDSNKCYLNSSQDQADQVGQYDYWKKQMR